MVSRPPALLTGRLTPRDRRISEAAGYLNSQGMCVTKRTMTSYHYAKHNMPFDLLPLLPLDLLCLVARTPKGRLRLLGVLRLPRTLRIYRVSAQGC